RWRVHERANPTYVILPSKVASAKQRAIEGGERLKAIVQDRYGESAEVVLQLQEIATPEPGPGEVLIEVRAASLFVGDWHIMAGLPYAIRPSFGLRRPKTRVRGQDVAGTVVTVGPGSRSQPGDDVYGTCDGSFAQFVAASDSKIAVKPASLTFEQAATVPIAGTTALQAVRDAGKVRAGQTVLIVGAGGGVGLFAVQIANALGARVTGVCSTTQIELVRSLGADAIVDYTKDDFTHLDKRYDVIVVFGGGDSVSRLRQALTPEGTLVVGGGEGGGNWLGRGGRLIYAPLLSPFVSQRLVGFGVKHNGNDLSALRELIEAGKVTPIVGRTYPLTGVPDAMRDLQAGSSGGGKTVIAVRE
ncbi:MAG TPA: NAD(P)-dependent alcohol dehydrogenase, partial [Actinomycetota bacterium]